MSPTPNAPPLEDHRAGALPRYRACRRRTAALLLLSVLFACGEGDGSEPSKAAEAGRTGGDSTRGASPAQSGGEQAEQVIQLRPGAAGSNVGLWAAPNASALLRVEPDTAIKDPCSLTLPPGITSNQTSFDATKGATLRLSAAGNARTSAASIRCGSGPPMRFSVVVPANPAGSATGTAQTATDTGLWVALGLAVIVSLAALAGLVYTLLMMSRRLASLDKTMREAAQKNPPSSPEVASGSARRMALAEALASTMKEAAEALTLPLSGIKATLESGNTARDQVLKHLELAAAQVVTASRDLAPAGVADHAHDQAGSAAPDRSAFIEPPSTGDGVLPAKWTDRLQEVVEAAYAGRTRIGNNSEVVQEAKRLQKLTRAITESSTLLAKQVQANAGDPKFDAVRQPVSRLRIRCEQLLGRFSELQGASGTAAFPLTAYILPTHDGLNSVADSITTGLRESVSVLEGRTEPLTREFAHLVDDYLQPALRAANVLRRTQPSPDWLIPLLRELNLEEDQPRAGDGFVAGRHDSVGGSSHTIADVYAPGYLFGGRVLLPALVRTDEVEF